MAVLILAAICALSLLLVPLGLPGTWVMLAAAIGYDMLVPEAPIGGWAIGVVTALSILAEYLEFSLAGRYARKYGGSRRAGWGALVGGFAGAIIGLPIPILGSMIGAFAGAFVGALIAEYTRREATAGTNCADGISPTHSIFRPSSSNHPFSSATYTGSNHWMFGYLMTKRSFLGVAACTWLVASRTDTHATDTLVTTDSFMLLLLDVPCLASDRLPPGGRPTLDEIQ